MENNPAGFDVPGVNFLSDTSSNRDATLSFRSNPPIGARPMVNGIPQRPAVVPPPPPRPVNYNRNYGGYNSPGSFFNGFGGYSNYGTGYGLSYRPPFGSYGYGYGPSGYYGMNNPESRFIQFAEERTRPAFQTIQSILQAFSSASMMFESTFGSLYSSYMSVIGVADNFAKLRETFGNMFSAFTVFRMFHWLYRQLLYLLGLSDYNPGTESIWKQVVSNAAGLNGEQQQQSQKPWSTMLFLAIITAGPYLLFKLMSHLCPARDVWDPNANPGTLSIGMYDFYAANDQELSFSANQRLMIAPQQFQPNNAPGWLLACDSNRKIGLIPNNYVKMVLQKVKNPNGPQYAQNTEIPKNSTQSTPMDNVVLGDWTGTAEVNGTVGDVTTEQPNPVQ